MRRLLLTSATTLLALAVLVPSARAEWVWPLHGEVITQYLNGGDPYASGQHRGIDIAGDAGTAVVAAAAGEVRFAGTAGSSGLTVSIRTSDGRFDTSYVHLGSTSVRQGDRVGAGNRIGTVGTSGARSATAPHLHFGIRDAGTRHAYHDPLGFLPPPAAGPQPPRETPAPQPAPAPASPTPASPAPAPVRAPAGHRAPARVPARRPAPVAAPDARRVPLGAPTPRRVPLGAPNARAVPVTSPSTPPAPDSAGRPAPAHPASSRRIPAHAGLGPAPLDLAARPTQPSPSRPAPPNQPIPPQAGESSAPGPDHGLVLACLGLLAAAAVLGLSQDRQEATRTARHRIVRALQPMLGRR